MKHTKPVLLIAAILALSTYFLPWGTGSVITQPVNGGALGTQLTCYDSNATHTGAAGVEFLCATSPSFTPVTGSVISFRFAAAGNAATPKVNVNGLGLKNIQYPDQADNFGNPPANSLLGDACCAGGGLFYLMFYSGSAWIVQQNAPGNVATVGQNTPTQNGIVFSAGTSGGEGAGVLTVDTGCTRPSAGNLSCTGGGTFAGTISGSTKFTISGCSAGTTVGGGTAGTFTSGTTGTCTVVITMNGATGLTAPTGWACDAADRTTPADLVTQTASSTTTATLSGPTVSGDVVSFKCIGY